ncbi:sulfotransferase family protein [Metabacillus halosaccharovorans]|uniref:sulfotransferase family protein n=1 Tax=Metabacillus halosaccharovorans TaxID=930124 RepID=UPI003736AA57
MIKSAGENLTFLLCVPRSGSSLTTTILQNHSKIFATQEMWFLLSLYNLQNPQKSSFGGTAIIDRFYNNILPKEVYQDACRSFAKQVYSGLLQTSGGEIVLDKSPRYYYLLEFLDTLFPLSKRIWLIRNPLAVLASYKKLNTSRGKSFLLHNDLLSTTFNPEIADITVGLLRYAHYFSNKNEYSFKLYYEKLVQNPKVEVGKLCKFLGLDYEVGLEQYGEFLHTPKGNMFASMGVGDPFVFDHVQPHQNSIDIWKEVLDKKEVEMYCETLGADIFHELGYSSELEEAEKWTGVKFQSEPDMDLIRYRTEQIKSLSKFDWLDQYKMRINTNVIDDVFFEKHVIKEESSSKNELYYENQQLKITLNSLEKRLENSYQERERLHDQLQGLRNKVDKIKGFIPFKKLVNNWMDSSLLNSGRKK